MGILFFKALISFQGVLARIVKTQMAKMKKEKLKLKKEKIQNQGFLKN